MVIYLKHPRHGTKVACTEEEAKADEGRGWSRYEVAKPGVVEPEAVLDTTPERVETANALTGVGGSVVSTEVPTISEADEIKALRAKYKEKHGKAAHPKMKIETLRKEVAA